MSWAATHLIETFVIMFFCIGIAITFWWIVDIFVSQEINYWLMVMEFEDQKLTERTEEASETN